MNLALAWQPQCDLPQSDPRSRARHESCQVCPGLRPSLSQNASRARRFEQASDPMHRIGAQRCFDQCGNEGVSGDIPGGRGGGGKGQGAYQGPLARASEPGQPAGWRILRWAPRRAHFETELDCRSAPSQIATTLRPGKSGQAVHDHRAPARVTRATQAAPPSPEGRQLGQAVLRRKPTNI